MIQEDDKRELKYEYWRRAKLDYILYPEQIEIEEAFGRIKRKLLVVNCSRRLGKTYWIAKKAIEVALRGDRRIVKLATSTLRNIENFILPSFRSILEDCPKELMPEWRETKKKFIFKNGSTIDLVGLDVNPDGVRGNYCDLFAFDEAAFVKGLIYLYSSVVVPMTMMRDGAKIIMMSTPAPTPDSEFREFCDKAKDENSYIELTIDKNSRLTEKQKQEYLNECLTESDKLREYYCKFAIDTRRAITPEWKDSFIMEWPKNKYFPFYHKYVAMDIGGAHLTELEFAYWDFLSTKLIFEDELSFTRNEVTSHKIATECKRKEVSLWGKTPVFKRVADNNNIILLNDLNKVHKLSFGATSKDNLDAMVNKVREWLILGKIIINPKCKHLIGCLRSALWNEKRTKFAESITYGHYDALAAMIYMVRNVVENINPIPATLGMSHNTHYIPTGFGENRNELNNLKKAFPLLQK